MKHSHAALPIHSNLSDSEETTMSTDFTIPPHFLPAQW